MALSNLALSPIQVGDYEISKTIGRGNFAVVRLGKHRVAKSRVAIKIIDKEQINCSTLDKVHREITIMKHLNHPHIVRLYQVMETDRMIYIVTNYASKGELFDHVRSNGRMLERDARRLFTQMVSAVAYCHARSIVHRDLKTENLLLDADMNIVLADFGFSNFYTNGQLLNTWCGSPPYAAPELLNGVDYDGCKSDTWSLGIILYILVTGGFPFPGRSVELLRQAVSSGRVEIPFYVSVECADLIRKILVVDPSRRISLQQLINHRWLRTGCPPETVQLLEQSLRGEVTSSEVEEDQVLSDAIVKYLIQHGLPEETIVKCKSVDRAFDRGYASYHLLLDRARRRLTRRSELSVTSALSALHLHPPIAHKDGASTDVAMDTSNATLLGQAYLDELFGNDSDVSAEDAAPEAAQRYRQYRRHTVDQNAGTAFPYVPPRVPYPVNMLPQPVPSSFANNYLLCAQALVSIPCGLPPLPLPSNVQFKPSTDIVPTALPTQALPPHGSFLGPAPGTLFNLNLLPSQVPSHSLAQPLGVDVSSGDEDSAHIQRYLKVRGNRKRHTVHATPGGAPSPTHPLSRQHSPALGYSRLQPYRPSGGSRGSRGSSNASEGTSGLPSSWLAHLERLHNEAISSPAQAESPNPGVRQLQAEFRQLQTEQSILANRQQSSPNSRAAAAATEDPVPPTDPRLSRPSISVTDERGLPTSAAVPQQQQQPVSAVCAVAVKSYQSQAAAILAGSHHQATQQQQQQLCEQRLLSQRAISDLVNDIKRVLEKLEITYQEEAVSTCDEVATATGGSATDMSNNCPSVIPALKRHSDGLLCPEGTLSGTSSLDSGVEGNASRRLSLESDDGLTRMEIGVSPQRGSNLSQLEFRCLHGDPLQYQSLCKRLITNLHLHYQEQQQHYK